MIENWTNFVQISDELCLRWVISLLHLLWQGAVIGFVVLIGNRALRDRSAGARYLLNLAALFCLPIAVAITFLLVDVSMWPGPAAPRHVSGDGASGESEATSPLVATLADEDVLEIDSVTGEPLVATGNPQTTLAPDAVGSTSRSGETGLANSTGGLARLARPLSLIYCAGAFLFLLRLAVALWGGDRLRSAAREISDPKMLRIIADQARDVGLKFVPIVGYCERVAVPTVVGLMKPLVLIPSSLIGLDTEHLAAIICHEFAHIRRRDLLMNLLQRVIESLLFFHPATWYISRRVSAERELCCDDLALSSGQHRLRYAQALLETARLCLGARSADVTALSADGDNPSELERRIQRLVGVRPKSRLQLSRAGLSMMLVWLALLIAVPGLFDSWTIAQDKSVANKPDAVQTIVQAPERTKISEPTARDTKPAEETEPDFKKSVPNPAHRVSVLCVDMEGNPVAGAEVHLFQNFSKGEDSRYLHFGPSKSDAEGKTLFSKAIFSNSLGNFDRWVYARVPGKLVGVCRSARWINRRKIINPEARVKMILSRSVVGKATVPAGFDPSSVTVRVRTMHVSTGKGSWDYASFPRDHHFRGLDTSLPDIFECRPDAKGRIQFTDVPLRGHLYLVTSGPGLGEAQWRNDWNSRSFDQPIEFTIEKEKRILGRVLSPAGEPVAGVEVRARISSSGVMHLSTFRSVTDVAGKFELSGLPAVEFTVSVSDPNERWVLRPLEEVRGAEKPGRELNLKMETGVWVSGTVADPEGNLVEGAAISALADTKKGPGLDGDMTDHNGQYRLRVPTGRAKFYFNALPDGFQYPKPQIVKYLDIKAEETAIEDLDFTLEKKAATNE